MTDETISPAGEFAEAGETSRRARWSWLARGITASIGISLVSGLYLYFFAAANWNAGQIVLGSHIGLGVLAVVLLIAWMFEHLMKGIDLAKNNLFFWLSWLFLGIFTVAEPLIAQAALLVVFLFGWLWMRASADRRIKSA